MACRIGTTTDLTTMRAYWKSQHPQLRNWKILASALSYYEALNREKVEALNRGCVYTPRAHYVEGNVWSVYCFEF